MIDEKVSRGSFGYIRYKKTNLAVKSIILGVVIMCIMITGFLIYKTVKNWITLPSLITVIPFANFAASYFAFCKFKSPDKDKYEALSAYGNAGMLLSDLIIVDKNGKRFNIDFAVIYKGGIVAYGPSFASDKYLPETHVNELLKNHGINMRMKVFNDFDDFKKRISQIDLDVIEDTNLINKTKETIINTCM